MPSMDPLFPSFHFQKRVTSKRLECICSSKLLVVMKQAIPTTVGIPSLSVNGALQADRAKGSTSDRPQGPWSMHTCQALVNQTDCLPVYSPHTPTSIHSNLFLLSAMARSYFHQYPFLRIRCRKG